MLEQVEVTDFSLLRSANLALSPGLTCISGESGAGKSLLFDAIAFACGGRTHRNLLAAGAASCSVSLGLRLTAQQAQQLGAPWQAGRNTLARRYASSGRAQSMVNGTAVKAQEAQAAASRLIEITGQFESAMLFNPSTHAGLLDAFGGPALHKVVASYANQYAQYRELANRLDLLRNAEQNRAQEVDFLQFQTAELEKAGVEPGERSTVEARLRLQEHGESILRHAGSALQLLSGGDDGGSAYDLAAQAQRELQEAARLLGADATDTPGNSAAEAAELLEAVLAQIQESAHLCQALADSVVFDPEAARQASARLDELLRLERKYGVAADELPALLDSLSTRLAVLTDATQSPEEVARQLAEANLRLLREGEELSRLRAKAAATIQKEAGKYFAQLEFPRCELQVELARLEAPGPGGLDAVELLIILNPGEPPRPLAQVASGGEASRLLLGLKAALADKLDFGTLLLDEIEAGLGGRTAQRVGDVLIALAEGRQVFAITHLPVVAARAEQHLVVRKQINGGRTEARITQLEGDDRRMELARMLGGLGSTEELAVVDQLLAQAIR